MYNEKIDITELQWKKLLKDRNVFEEKDLKLLKMIYASNNNMSTAKNLALLLNIDHHGPVNLQVGRLGKRVVKELNIKAPTRDDGRGRWWHVLFWGKDTKEGFYWILRPELKDAMQKLSDEKKLDLLNTDISSPEEIELKDSSELYEGATKEILVNRYERNKFAREQCINHYGLNCMVCGFDFAAVYGDIGKNVIHVHHITPLSEIGQNTIVDPVKDLRPVCPNCHTILHKKNPPFSIEEVKTMMAQM